MPKPAALALDEDKAAATGPSPNAKGFKGWSETEEGKLERPAPGRDLSQDAFIAEARVVYLGSAKRKTVVRPGGLIQIEREDGTFVFVPAPKEAEMNLAYDFSRQDSRGKPIRSRLTHDGKPFAICRHIQHLAWFYEQLDGEGGAVFELRAPPAVLQKVKAYIERTRRNIAANREHPINVLTMMGDPWATEGGEVGEALSA